MSKQSSHSSRSKRSFTRRLAEKKKLLIPAALVIFAGFAAGAYYLTRGHASPEERIANAKQHEQKGDHAAAVIEIKNALQQQPGNAEARFILGRIHYANNDHTNAEKELRQALDKGYQAPEATILLARTLLLLRQPGKLLKDVNVLPGASADANATILALRAQAHVLSGDRETAETNLAQADELVPEHPDTLAVRAGLAYARKDSEQALLLVDKAIAKAEQRVDLLLMKADLYRALPRPDEAFVAYGKVLAREPGNLPARLAVAQHYLAAAQLDKARAELATLKTYAPNNLMGRYLEGLIEFRQKHFEAANNKLQEVLRSAPDFVQANLLVGAIALSQGKRESAITHLNRVLEAAPDHTLGRKLLATAMLESGQAERARELISNLKNDDQDAQLLALQGNIALRQGAYQEARRKLEKAAELTPGNTALIRELAASRMASGDESGAVAALTELAEKDSSNQQADVLLVMTHAKAKRYDDALKVSDDLERRHPGLPLTENLRGIIHLLRQDEEQARRHFTKAMAIDAGYLPAASNLARLDLMKKDIQSARARFQGVLKKDPKNARAMVSLAQIAALEKNEAEYLKQLEQAKKADAANAAPRQMLARYWLGKRDAEKALVEARSALDATRNPEFLDLIGAAQLMQNNAADALASYQKWVVASPTNPLAHYRLAMAQQIAKDHDGALKSLDKALGLRPEFTDASVQKALLLARAGKPDEGLRIARSVQTRAPKAAGGYIAEAEILFGTRKYLDAARLFLKGAQLGKHGQAMLRAHQAFVAGGQAAEGEKQLAQWLASHGADVPVRHALAQSLLNNKRHAEATAQYRILAQGNPNDLIALNNLAWLLGANNPAEALRVAEQAYKIAPNNAAVLDTLGWLLAQAGQAQRAVTHLRAAVKLAQDNPEIRWHLALALEKAGDKREAAAELDRLVTSHGDHPQAAQAREKLRELRGMAK